MKITTSGENSILTITVLGSMNRNAYSFIVSVILIPAVMFTVLIFGQIQCKKRKAYSLLIRSYLFGHLN